MDEIRFLVQRSQEYGREVAIEINGENLIDKLQAFELPFARAEGHPEIAGSYMRLAATTLLSRQFFGEWEFEERVAVLACGDCGHVFCWPMMVKITLGVDRVTWSEFQQPHRTGGETGTWDYQRFGPFVFDRHQYEQALEQAAKKVRR